jgi:hypothetical protein
VNLSTVPPWRVNDKVSLPVRSQNSHQNGGRVFLIFVADPRTVPTLARLRREWWTVPPPLV